MTDTKIKALTDVQGSIHKMISAHEAIAEGIATHAEKQRALHNAARHAARERARIAEGVKRQNEQVRAASQ